MRRTSSSSILVTDSNTPPSGITNPFINNGGKTAEAAREGGDGELGHEDRLAKLELGQSNRSERGDKLAIDWVVDANGEEGLTAKEDKISERDAKTSKLEASSSSAGSGSGSGSDSGSFVTSQISLSAKLSGPIGMTIGLAPAPLTEVIGTVKDKLNSMDRSKVTNSAIPSVILENKKNYVEKLENEKYLEKKNCTKSNAKHTCKIF